MSSLVTSDRIATNLPQLLFQFTVFHSCQVKYNNDTKVGKFLPNNKLRYSVVFLKNIA